MTHDSSGERHPDLVVVDLGAIDSKGCDGVVWSLRHGGDLDVNLVHLAAGGSIGEHVNDEVDVTMSVMTGSGELAAGSARHDLRAGVLVSIPKGVQREVRAGADGMTYLSIHRRRGPLLIGGTRPSLS